MSQQLELLTESSSQWTAVSFVTPNIQRKEIKPFVVLSLKELEGNPDSRTSSLMNTDKFAAVRAVVRHVTRLRSGTKEPWSLEDVTIFLEGLRFSPECCSELATLLCMEKIYETIPKHLRLKPGLVSLQWKIDLSLCQANLTSPADSQQLKERLHRDAHIILALRLTDGRTSTYRLSLNQFHELRFAVASALKSIIVMEKRKCMRRD